MVHTPETRAKMGAGQRRHNENMSPEDRAKRVTKAMKTRVANGTYAPPRRGTTWKASWREIGGIRKFYRSKWEANYARYLEWLRILGKVASWAHEPDVFWFNGILRGTRSYLPDFKVIFPDGRVEYHEVKGWMDAASKTKIRRMAKYHPAVKLVVVDSKAYGQLAKAVGGLVDGWE